MNRRMHVLACIALLAPFAARAAPADDASGILRQLDRGLSQLADRVSPAVVQIVVSGYGLAGQEQGRAAATIARQHVVGSGVVVDPGGYIVTNAHVVQGAQRIVVVAPLSRGGSRDRKSWKSANYQAHVVGIHPESDLAVLKIEAADLPALPLRNSAVRQGQLVFAIGAPQGLASTITMGIVSSAARQIQIDAPMVFIQTDAPINPGNSGGPLVNADGEVVGINTLILSGSGGSEGLGFAIPAPVARFVYENLRAHGYVRRMEMGMSAQAVTPELALGLGLPRDYGVVVSDVDPGGPADTAGLRPGDVLESVDGRRIDILPDVAAALYLATKERLQVGVLRGGKLIEVSVQAVQRDHALEAMAGATDVEQHLVRRLGIIAVDADDNVRRELHLRKAGGVVVVARTLQGPSASSELAPGDAIHTIDGKPIGSVEEFRKALKESGRGNTVVLQVERNGRLHYVVFDLD